MINEEPDIEKEIGEATEPVAKKPILVLDFDGVIHDYMEGWKDGKIYGHVTKGFFAWADAAKDIFELHIFSSRSVLQMRDMHNWLLVEFDKWVLENAAPNVVLPEWPDFDFIFDRTKPPAFLTIDDRGITFQGDWGQLNPTMLRAFKPWNKK